MLGHQESRIPGRKNARMLGDEAEEEIEVEDETENEDQYRDEDRDEYKSEEKYGIFGSRCNGRI